MTKAGLDIGAEAIERSAHRLTMTVLMTPDTANFAGNVHGGTLLKLLDQVAYACASRYAGATSSPSASTR